MTVPQSKWQALWLAARPKTLSASFVPVLVGTSLAYNIHGQWHWWVAALALLGALFIQIATNLFNDAIDFIKGADTTTRLGEARATQSGWLTSKKVLTLGFICLALATACGLPLVIHGGWPILIIGLLSLFLGYAYTGGPFPLAYLGLGDLFVLIFFGWIAVGGVVFLHSGIFDLPTLILGTQVGLLATVLIAINNIRDQEQDQLVNKRTLSVRLGRFSKWEVSLLFLFVFLLNFFWLLVGYWISFLFTSLLITPAILLSHKVLKSKPSTQFNKFLGLASLIHILFGILISIGFFYR